MEIEYDPELNGRLYRAATPLLEKTGLDHVGLLVIRDREGGKEIINAFASGDLLSTAAEIRVSVRAVRELSETELAAVVAHEIGHIILEQRKTTIQRAAQRFLQEIAGEQRSVREEMLADQVGAKLVGRKTTASALRRMIQLDGPSEELAARIVMLEGGGP